ncbi:hypothetical protein UlMin_016771 [Ulmus minor]
MKLRTIIISIESINNKLERVAENKSKEKRRKTLEDELLAATMVEILQASPSFLSKIAFSPPSCSSPATSPAVSELLPLFSSMPVFFLRTSISCYYNVRYVIATCRFLDATHLYPRSLTFYRLIFLPYVEYCGRLRFASEWSSRHKVFNTNYHLRDRRRLGGDRKKELFNYRHASLRNAGCRTISTSEANGYNHFLCRRPQLFNDVIRLRREIMKRDIWHAFISEVIALHKFIRNYGPEDGDESKFNVYGAHKRKRRATISAINSIARLQALQYMRKLLDDPIKLVPFSYLHSVPYGDVVCQTLAMRYWGGPLIKKFVEVDSQPVQEVSPNEVGKNCNHVFDLDGSVYLRKWMKSPSWSSSDSISFWKSSLSRQGVVLSKNLVVADYTLVGKAAETCRRKCELVEKTQATIDAAMLKGIPSNIDLFKELLLPLTIVAKNFEKLRHWEEPHLTVSCYYDFFVFVLYIIFAKLTLLSFVFPTLMIIAAASMLTLKRLKEQGRLGRSFGKVTIRDQPPSNTIQKIIAVKDAMRDVENYLQSLNVTLLKMRTIILSGQPQVTMEVALALLSSATILLTVPFKYVLAFLIFDLFTRELGFRKEMVKTFMSFVKQRWNMVPAAPVVVLPFESEESKSEPKGTKDQSKLGKGKNSSNTV